MMNTGHTQVGRPSMGAWLTYGLGSENKNLPGLRRPLPGDADDGGAAAVEQRLPAGGAPGDLHLDKVENKNEIIGKDFDPKKLVSYHAQREVLAARAAARDRSAREARRDARRSRDPQLEAAIESMEVAYRMQTEAPEVFDIRKETQGDAELYGPGSTARSCLMAVRLVAAAACAWCRSTTRPAIRGTTTATSSCTARPRSTPTGRLPR